MIAQKIVWGAPPFFLLFGRGRGGGGLMFEPLEACVLYWLLHVCVVVRVSITTFTCMLHTDCYVALFPDHLALERGYITVRIYGTLQIEVVKFSFLHV